MKCYELELNDGSKVGIIINNKDYNRIKYYDWEDTLDNLNCLVHEAGVVDESVDISNFYDIDEGECREKYPTVLKC